MQVTKKEISKEKKALVKAQAKKKAKKVVKKELGRALGSGPAGLAAFHAARSAWLNSIMDPFSHFGAKIPDSVTSPSFPLHCVQRFQNAIYTNGVSGAAYIVGGSAGSLYTVSGGTATALTWASGAAPTYMTNLAPFSDTVRTVSCGLAVSFQGSPLNASGRIITFWNPGITGLSGFPYVNPSTVLAFSNARSIPLSKGYSQVINLPQDSRTLFYQVPLYTVAAGSPAKGFLYIAIDGAPVGSIVEFTLVENFEVIPNTSSLNLVQPTASSSDPFDFSLTSNFVADHPDLATEIPAKNLISDTPFMQGAHVNVSSHQAKSETTFMEKLVGGINLGLDVVETLAPMAPLLLAAL